MKTSAMAFLILVIVTLPVMASEQLSCALDDQKASATAQLTIR